MPRLLNRAKVENNVNDDDVSHDSEASPSASSTVQKSASKRSNAATDAATSNGEDQAQDFGNEMQKMLDCFGADISKTLVAKRRRLEQYTQNSLKTSNRKVEEIWVAQQAERKKLNDEFHKQAGNVFQQWEVEMEKSKDQEEKLQGLFKQQQKLFQQTRVIYAQRLKAIRQLHDQYTKGMDDLEKCHHDQQGNVHSELKKEMAMLQKRILMDTQQQEMKSVRKSLQTMLF